jgi:hypothetical protein
MWWIQVFPIAGGDVTCIVTLEKQFGISQKCYEDMHIRNKDVITRQAWLCTPVIPALWKLRQENHKLQTNSQQEFVCELSQGHYR